MSVCDCIAPSIPARQPLSPILPIPPMLGRPGRTSGPYGDTCRAAERHRLQRESENRMRAENRKAQAAIGTSIAAVGALSHRGPLVKR